MTSRDFWSGKDVAVTGGTGFLGQHLVSRLLELCARVRVLDLRPGGDTRATQRVGDIRNAEFVRHALAGCHVVFHAAGTVAVWGKGLADMHAIHCDGTRNVLAAVPSARIVHTSSIVAVGASRTPTPVNEDTPFNLANIGVAYVTAKRAAEEIALEAATRQDVVIVNPAYLLGPNDPGGSITGRLVKRFWAGRVLLSPRGGLNLVDVRDVAEGHLLAAERGIAGRRYILGGEDMTGPALTQLLAEVGQLRPRWLPQMPSLGVGAIARLAELRGWLTGREPYPSLAHVRIGRWFFFADSSRARRELGYAPRSLRNCLIETHAWYLARGLTGPRGLARWWFRAA